MYVQTSGPVATAGFGVLGYAVLLFGGYWLIRNK